MEHLVTSTTTWSSSLLLPAVPASLLPAVPGTRLVRAGFLAPLPPGYFSHLTSLNNLLTMAQQLSTDAQHCVSHKYIAHQTALLYVSPAAGTAVCTVVVKEGSEWK